ncbi:hypothetical protein MAFF212519_25140 [Clavibacter michiganensis]
MDPHANARPSVVRGGLAVTLVSASDLGAASRVAAAAVGAPASAAPAVVEAPGGDSGDLGADLADGLIADVDDGRRGLAVVALEPAADPLEVALVLEHVVEARHPGSTPIGILDVVAVSSVAEIRELLLEPGDADTTPFDAAERLAGRLECASVVVLDDLDPDRPTPGARRAVALLAHLAPDARVVATADRASLAPAPCASVADALEGSPRAWAGRSRSRARPRRHPPTGWACTCSAIPAPSTPAACTRPSRTTSCRARSAGSSAPAGSSASRPGPRPSARGRPRATC